MSAAVMTEHDDSKRVATAKAQLALAGWVLTDIEGDDGQPLYVVSRWAQTRDLHSVTELEAFCRLVGAAR